MKKQHRTFPNEQPEMPAPKGVPEVSRPSDPKEPEIPQEDPEQEPDELPETDLPEKQSDKPEE
jgi:hypothetical protein